MRHYIDTEIKLADVFVKKYQQWEYLTEDWITEHFGTHSIEVSPTKYNDTQVCLITTDF